MVFYGKSGDISDLNGQSERSERVIRLGLYVKPKEIYLTVYISMVSDGEWNRPLFLE